MRALQRKVDARTWGLYFAVAVVAATSFELVPIHFGLWRYYGDNQPLQVLGFPGLTTV